MDKLYHLFEIFKESFLDFGNDWVDFLDVEEVASKHVGYSRRCDDQ